MVAPTPLFSTFKYILWSWTITTKDKLHNCNNVKACLAGITGGKKKKRWSPLTVCRLVLNSVTHPECKEIQEQAKKKEEVIKKR